MRLALDVNGVNQVLARCRAIPGLRGRYPERIGDEAELRGLPLMDKGDLRRMFRDLEAAMIAAGRRAYLVSTGGTTDAPNLSLIPTHMFLPDIVKAWRPLGPEDVFCNMYPPGKLWGAHYFYNALGQELAGETIALGPIQPAEFEHWAAFLVERGVTALGGVPTTLKQLFGLYSHHGLPRPPVRKVLWVGEPCDAHLVGLLATVFPAAETWGLYGSVQTWPIGHNGPRCPLDSYHVLPYQQVELVDGEIVLTNTHPDCLNVLLRYRTGDAGAWAPCPCGDPAPALRVLGRIDDSFNFRAVLVTPGEFIRLATSVPGVVGAQLGLITTRGPAGVKDDLEIRVVLAPGHAAALPTLRRNLHAYLGTRLGLNNLTTIDADAIRVVDVPELAGNARTTKTPTVVRVQA